VRDGDCGGFVDIGMTDGGVLEIDRTDPLAARLDQIFAAVVDRKVAVAIERGDVAGAKPAVGRKRERSRVGIIVVSTDNPWPAHVEFALRFAVVGESVPVVIENLHVHAVDHAPGLHLPLQAIG